MKRILAIDYGQARVGTAISDALKLLATPYKTIINKGYESLLAELRIIIDTEDIGLIVVGHPTFNDGTDSPQTMVIKSFTAKIKADLSVEVLSYDERYSSVEAKAIIAANRTAGKNRSSKTTKRNKGEIDCIAASIILRSYLEDTDR